MSEHTKGPWRIKPGSVHPWIIECEVNMPPGYPDKLYNTVGTAGYKPNAHLIAAAPGLLEALKTVVRDGTAAPWVIEECETAIAKAKGGTP